MKDITITITHELQNNAKNTDIWSVYANSGELESALEMIDTAWLRNLTIGELMDMLAEEEI